jgi:ABC-type multidrug transport system fused ATPase/permease subunit
MAKRNRNNGAVDSDTPKVKLSKETLREALSIFSYIKPYKWKFIIGLVFIVLSSLTTMAFPYLLKELIDSADALSKGLAAISPGKIALQILAVLVIQMLFSFLRIYLFTIVGEHALSDMRRDIYQRMIMMPMEFFSQRRVGELSSRISADLSQIQDAVTLLLAEVLRGILTLVIGLILIFYLSPKLTLLMLSVVPIIVVVGVIFGNGFVNLHGRRKTNLPIRTRSCRRLYKASAT